MGLDLASTALNFFISSLFELLFILIPLIIFKFFKKSPKQEFIPRIFPDSRSWQRRIFDIGIGMYIGYSFVYIGGDLARLIYKITINVFGSEFYGQASAGSVNVTPPSLTAFELAITIFIMYVIVGLCEEYCFRGVLMKEIGKKGPIFGLLLSSGLFMLYHVFPGVVPIQTFVTFWLYYFVFGILLGITVLVQKGDLLTAIIAHGTFNSVLFYLQFT